MHSIELTKASKVGMAPPKDITGMNIDKMTKIQAHKGVPSSVGFPFVFLVFFMVNFTRFLYQFS